MWPFLMGFGLADRLLNRKNDCDCGCGGGYTPGWSFGGWGFGGGYTNSVFSNLMALTFMQVGAQQQQQNSCWPGIPYQYDFGDSLQLGNTPPPSTEEKTKIVIGDKTYYVSGNGPNTKYYNDKNETIPADTFKALCGEVDIHPDGSYTVTKDGVDKKYDKDGKEVTAPAATTSAPAATTSAPAATTSAPAATTSAPAATTSAPAATTSAPAATTSAPAATTSAPAAMTGGKEQGNGTPAAVTHDIMVGSTKYSITLTDNVTQYRKNSTVITQEEFENNVGEFELDVNGNFSVTKGCKETIYDSDGKILKEIVNIKSGKDSYTIIKEGENTVYKSGQNTLTEDQFETLVGKVSVDKDGKYYITASNSATVKYESTGTKDATYNTFFIAGKNLVDPYHSPQETANDVRRRKIKDGINKDTVVAYIDGYTAEAGIGIVRSLSSHKLSVDLVNRISKAVMRKAYEMGLNETDEYKVLQEYFGAKGIPAYTEDGKIADSDTFEFTLRTEAYYKDNKKDKTAETHTGLVRTGHVYTATEAKKIDDMLNDLIKVIKGEKEGTVIAEAEAEAEK